MRTHNLKRTHTHTITHTHTHTHTSTITRIHRVGKPAPPDGPSVPTTHTHTHMRAITHAPTHAHEHAARPISHPQTRASTKALLHHATHSVMVRPIRAITLSRTPWPKMLGPHITHFCRPLATLPHTHTHTHATSPSHHCAWIQPTCTACAYCDAVHARAHATLFVHPLPCPPPARETISPLC